MKTPTPITDAAVDRCYHDPAHAGDIMRDACRSLETRLAEKRGHLLAWRECAKLLVEPLRLFVHWREEHPTESAGEDVYVQMVQLALAKFDELDKIPCFPAHDEH